MFRGGGGFARMPMTDNPLQMLIGLLIVAVLVWLLWKLVNSLTG